MSTWTGVAGAYARSFGSLCAGTVERVLDDLPPGALLDVGSGDGRLAAAATARCRRVTAVDSDPGMVRLTNAAVPRSCTQQALPALAVASGSFPAVVANFVVNHLPDPRAGVRELARVTAAGGRLAMTIWPTGGAGWAPMVERAFNRAGAGPAPEARLDPAVDFPRSVPGLSLLAVEAGLHVAVAEEISWDWRVRPDDLWAGISGGVAGPGARYLAQSVLVRRRVQECFQELVDELATDDRLAFRCRAAYVVAAPAPR